MADDKKVIFSMSGVTKAYQNSQTPVLKNIYLSFFYGAKIGIFVEETQIENFSNNDISHDFKPGGRTQNQLEQGKNGTSTITDVNTEVGKNYSETLNANNEVIARDYGSGQVTRQVTDTEVDSVELLFSVPRLFSTAQEGLAKGQL